MNLEWKLTKCMMDFERAVMNSFHEAVSVIQFLPFVFNFLYLVSKH
jgi:hypothetical protein